MSETTATKACKRGHVGKYNSSGHCRECKKYAYRQRRAGAPVKRVHVCRCDQDTTRRGVCGACYMRARMNGTVADLPRKNRPSRDTIEDYLFIHENDGGDPDYIAGRIGMTVGAIEKAFKRHGQVMPRWPKD